MRRVPERRHQRPRGYGPRLPRREQVNGMEESKVVMSTSNVHAFNVWRHELQLDIAADHGTAGMEQTFGVVVPHATAASSWSNPRKARHCQVGSLAFGGSWSQTLAVLAGNRHGWARHWPRTGAILVFEGRRGASRLMQSLLITANSVSLVLYYFSKSLLGGSLPNST